MGAANLPCNMTDIRKSQLKPPMRWCSKEQMTTDKVRQLRTRKSNHQRHNSTLSCSKRKSLLTATELADNAKYFSNFIILSLPCWFIAILRFKYFLASFFVSILAGKERLGRRGCLQEQDQRDEQEAGGQSERVWRTTYKEQIKNEITQSPAGAITQSAESKGNWGGRS